MAFTTPVADGTTFGSLTIAGAQVPTNAFVDANGNDAVAALLAAFGPLATDAHVQAIATLLGAPLPLATGAATDAKLAQILTAVTPVREVFNLAAANVASVAATLYGGQYILTQTATTYGTIAVQVLGPDGATWLTAASYTSADSANGHQTLFAANSIVRVTLTGTAGANVTLARVPA